MTQAASPSWLERLGDRINPILVKETRQALKSRQFTITFMLVLAAGLLVSFGGLALAGPNIDYRSGGAEFFLAYFCVLAVAIFVVVPFGAYRSLAGEQEERTFELLSITTLRPSQIVAGKLLSALVQMFLYYSAIVPFMAFTYLLKGIDVPTILLVLVTSFLASVGFSMFGLFLATFSNRRSWQIFNTVGMIAGMLFMTYVAVFAAFGMVEMNTASAMLNREFWIVAAIVLTAYVSCFALAFQLSVAQLTFEADNHSSRVRIVLVLQFLAFLGWVSYGWVAADFSDHEFLIAMTVLAGIFWGLAGAFLAVEQPNFSQRVRRQVPRQGAARALATLFFPGSGTGLGFVLANLVCLVGLVGLEEVTERWLLGGRAARAGGKTATLMALALAAYVMFYLELGALLVRAIRRARPLPMLGGALITLGLAGLGSMVPTFFALVLKNHQLEIYAPWQLSDPVQTLREVYKSAASPLHFTVLAPLAAAVLMFGLNLRTMAREVCAIDAAGRRRAPPGPGERRAARELEALRAAAEPSAGV